jgi:hypothetical protein
MTLPDFLTLCDAIKLAAFTAQGYESSTYGPALIHTSKLVEPQFAGDTVHRLTAVFTPNQRDASGNTSKGKLYRATGNIAPAAYPDLAAIGHLEKGLDWLVLNGRNDPNTGLPIQPDSDERVRSLIWNAVQGVEFFTGLDRRIDDTNTLVRIPNGYTVELRINNPPQFFGTTYVPLPPRSPRKWGRAWTPRWELEHAALVRQRKFARNMAKIEKDNTALRKRRTKLSRKRRAEKKRRDRAKLNAIPKACKPPKKYHVRKRRSKRKK